MVYVHSSLSNEYSFLQYFGRSGLKKNYELQIRNIINAGYRSIGEIPCVMGETGIPFDLNEKEAFETGDYKYQERMLDGIISALEQNFVGYKCVFGLFLVPVYYADTYEYKAYGIIVL